MKYTRSGTSMSESMGEVLYEAFKDKGQENVLKESLGFTFKEAQTTANNTGAYVNLLSKVLYFQAIERSEKILGLVDINEDLKRNAGNGTGAIQFPRMTPTIAYEVSEGQKVNYFSEGTDPIVVAPVKVVAGTSITWELKKRGMSDFVKYVLRNAATAVERKLCGDIVNGLAAGTGHSAVTGGVDYDAIIDAELLVNNAEHSNGVKYGFLADAIVLNGTGFAKMRKDADVKANLGFAQGVTGQVNPAENPLMFGNLEVIVTPYLTAAEAIVLERKKNILVKESDLETFDGRIPGSVDDEIIALMSYVMAILFPKAIAIITA